jgi:hypothetical protein
LGSLEKVEELVSKMSLEEKVKLLVGVGMPGLFGNPPPESPVLLAKLTLLSG